MVNLVKVTAGLISEAKMPIIRILSAEFLRIPRPEVEGLDDVVVGARMDVMDKRMEGVEKNVTAVLNSLQTLMAKHVEAAPVQGHYAAAAAAGGGVQKKVVKKDPPKRDNLQVGPRSRLNSKRSFHKVDD